MKLSIPTRKPKEKKPRLRHHSSTSRRGKVSCRRRIVNGISLFWTTPMLLPGYGRDQSCEARASISGYDQQNP